MFHTTKTRGEDYQIHPSPLSNGNVSVPHPSCRWGTESNPMHDQRWISHKTGRGASNRSQEGASRPRTVGAFQVAPLHRRPMRCFKCQRFSRHKATCHNPVRCAICSGRHETSVCINKHNEGQATMARCVNCKGNHHAWNPKCPEHLRLIQTGQRQATTQPRRERAATPRKQTISVTVPSTSGTSRTISFAETLKGVHP